jgi:hypothetical protein
MTILQRPLEFVTWLMVPVGLLFAVLMLADARVIEGAPAWLKPLKFAVSTAIYSATLAWVLRHLPDWPRLARRAAAVTAWVFVVEVALIAVQAARGTTSHFNTSNVVDGAIFSVMGIAIASQTVAAVAVTWALFRQTFADRAMGWALRLGMALAVAGASVGGVMTQPTAAQLAQARETRQMPRAGAHTVGAPDGGAGLPGTGWSLTHGDLRVSHFLGLHAMQVLPFVAWLLTRRRGVREGARVGIVFGAAVSYAALFLLLFAQAMIGQPLIAPSGAVASAFAAWAVGTVVLVLVAWRTLGATVTSRSALEIA